MNGASAIPDALFPITSSIPEINSGFYLEVPAYLLFGQDVEDYSLFRRVIPSNK
jgi:hypothetical protein